MEQKRTTGWQLTSVLRRVSRVLDAAAAPIRAIRGAGAGSVLAPAGFAPGRHSTDASGGAGPDAAPALGDARTVAAAQTRQLLSVALRDRYDALRAGRTDDDDATVLERTLAATGSVAAAEQMQTAWEDLSGPTRRAVLDPVRRLARAGRQSDGTTCGSSVLTMLAAAGDPTFALWLATGQVLSAGRPPEIRDAPAARLEALAQGPAEARFASAQRVLKQRTNHGALLGLPWPAALGTPPWGAARVARFVDVTFSPRMLDDTDRADLEGVLETVGRAVDRGVPVPLYSGGDSSRGVSAALPRHVVLVTGRTADGFSVWEPAAGKVEPVTTARLLAGGGPVRALGGWSHLVWAVLPRV